MIKGLVICEKQFEDVTVADIEELMEAKAVPLNGVCTFEVDHLLDLCEVAYVCQSICGVMHLFADFKFKDYDELFEQLKNLKFDDYMIEGISFKVTTERHGEHDFGSEDISKDFGEILVEKYPNNKVQLKKPDVNVYVYIDQDQCYVGIDMAGFNLGKRDYKIFLHQQSLRSTIAYCLVRLSGFDEETYLLDPFCGSGIIGIEAALYASGFPVHYYQKDQFIFKKSPMLKDADFDEFFDEIDSDKKEFKGYINLYDENLRCVAGTKKNAKIANVNKLVKVSKCEVEWLDTKLEEDKVDVVVTDPPYFSKVVSEKKILEIYKEFFYQIDFVLQKKGKIVLIVNNSKGVDETLEYFNVKEKRDIMIGDNGFIVYILARKFF